MPVIRWLDRAEGTRPCLSIAGKKKWLRIRFGREQKKAFSERYQGTRGIPIQWHYIFGGRISWSWRSMP